jgi:hypothetical protein
MHVKEFDIILLSTLPALVFRGHGRYGQKIIYIKLGLYLNIISFTRVSNDWLSWTQKWTFGFHERWEIFYIAKQPLVPVDGGGDRMPSHVYRVRLGSLDGHINLTAGVLSHFEHRNYNQIKHIIQWLTFGPFRLNIYRNTSKNVMYAFT